MWKFVAQILEKQIIKCPCNSPFLEAMSVAVLDERTASAVAKVFSCVKVNQMCLASLASLVSATTQAIANTHHKHGPSSHHLTLLQSALLALQTETSQSLNPKKVFSLGLLLVPGVVALRRAGVVGGVAHPELRSAVDSLTTAVYDMLLPRSQLKSFATAFSVDESAQDAGGYRGTQKSFLETLFATLRETISRADIGFLADLFEAFVQRLDESISSPSHVALSMTEAQPLAIGFFGEMCAITTAARHSHQVHKSRSVDVGGDDEISQCIARLLHSLHQHRMYTIQTSVTYAVASSVLERALRLVTGPTHPTTGLFEAANTVLAMNHRLLVGQLDIVLRRALHVPRNCPPALPAVAAAFLGQAWRTYSKMGKLSTLVVALDKVGACHTGPSGLHHVLCHREFLACVCDGLRSSTSVQTLALLNSLLDTVSNHLHGDQSAAQQGLVSLQLLSVVIDEMTVPEEALNQLVAVCVGVSERVVQPLADHVLPVQSSPITCPPALLSGFLRLVASCVSVVHLIGQQLHDEESQNAMSRAHKVISSVVNSVVGVLVGVEGMCVDGVVSPCQYQLHRLLVRVLQTLPVSHDSSNHLATAALECALHGFDHVVDQCTQSIGVAKSQNKKKEWPVWDSNEDSIDDDNCLVAQLALVVDHFVTIAAHAKPNQLTLMLRFVMSPAYLMSNTPSALTFGSLQQRLLMTSTVFEIREWRSLVSTVLHQTVQAVASRCISLGKTNPTHTLKDRFLGASQATAKPVQTKNNSMQALRTQLQALTALPCSFFVELSERGSRVHPDLARAVDVLLATQHSLVSMVSQHSTVEGEVKDASEACVLLASLLAGLVAHLADRVPDVALMEEGLSSAVVAVQAVQAAEGVIGESCDLASPRMGVALALVQASWKSASATFVAESHSTTQPDSAAVITPCPSDTCKAVVWVWVCTQQLSVAVEAHMSRNAHNAHKTPNTHGRPHHEDGKGVPTQAMIHTATELAAGLATLPVLPATSGLEGLLPRALSVLLVFANWLTASRASVSFLTPLLLVVPAAMDQAVSHLQELAVCEPDTWELSPTTESSLTLMSTVCIAAKHTGVSWRVAETALCLFQALLIKASVSDDQALTAPPTRVAIQNLVCNALKTFLVVCGLREYASILQFQLSELASPSRDRRIAAVRVLDLAVRTGTGWRRVQLLQRHRSRLLHLLITCSLSLVPSHTQDSQDSSPYFPPDVHSVMTNIFQTLTSMLSGRRCPDLTARDIALILQIPVFSDVPHVSATVSIDDASSPSIDATWTAQHMLVYTLVAHHLREAMRCVPVVVGHVRVMMQAVFAQASPTHTPPYLRRRAEQLGRLLELLASERVRMKKHVTAILGDFVRMCITTQHRLLHALPRNRTRSGDTVAPLRQAMLPGVYALVGVCSRHELQATFASLDASGRAVFKSLFEDYSQKHKFKGLV
eukprot:c13039_g1_i1.p1 GENE.c13039_g1_i1~~c13039_g1_i1.p1  ORF type:complete len:1531 (+),score=479.03 c13039_g1_i1:285-4595(+)